MAPALEGFDDNHAPAAARARRPDVDRFDRCIDRGGRRDPEQLADVAEYALAGGTGEQAVVTDAMKSLGKDVKEESTNELVGGKGHDLPPVGAAAAIVFVAEHHPGIVEADEASVRDRDPVSVARQIGNHRLWSGEQRLGIDVTAVLTDRGQVAQERAAVGKVRDAAVERELPGLVQRHEPIEKQAAEQLA